MSGYKLLDTNILIYLSKRELLLNDLASPDDRLCISVITYMEALGYPFESQDEQEIIEKLCDNLFVLQLEDDVVKLVIEIRKLKRIKLPDAIIAASAISNKATLITRNTSDFQNVHKDLVIVNPFEAKDSQ